MDHVTENFIYLDYNATTPLSSEVITSIKNSLDGDWGNPSSGHIFGTRAKQCIDTARQQIACMINGQSDEITFTSGGTEANNTIINSAVKYYNKLKLDTSKPHIITSDVEHDSIKLPLQNLCSENLIEISYIKAFEGGCVIVKDVLAAIKENTCLITIMFANNETGVIMPIEEMGAKLGTINRERKEKNLTKILYHTDAAQIIGKDTIDVQALNIDFMTIVGHKFYGPRIGCIWGREHIFSMLFGGGQERNIRPGTENTPMIVGLGKAAEIVNKNMLRDKQNMEQVRNLLEEKLIANFPDAIVNCKENIRLPNTCNISFNLGDFTGRDLLNNCKRVIASVGAACHSNNMSSAVLMSSGVPQGLAKSSVRLSVGRDTTDADVINAVEDLKQAFKNLSNIS